MAATALGRQARDGQSLEPRHAGDRVDGLRVVDNAAGRREVVERGEQSPLGHLERFEHGTVFADREAGGDLLVRLRARQRIEALLLLHLRVGLDDSVG